MSGVSSSADTPVERVIPGWLVAVISLLATVFLYYFAQAVGSLVISLYPLFSHMTHAEADAWLASSTSVQFLYGLVADGMIVGGVALLIKWFGWNWATIGFRRPRVAHLVVGVLAAVPYYVLYLAIVMVLKAILPSLDIGQKQELGFDSVNGLVSLTLAFASLVILPPLAEEILMRGFLFTGLKKWLPWTVAGLLVSMLFGAAHLAEGGAAGPLWIAAIDTFTLSVVLVVLREKTGNLWAGIMLHATKNLVAFAALFIIGVR